MRPSVTGDPAVRAPLTADPASGRPGRDLRHQSLRDGQPIAGADRHTFRPRAQDLRHEFDSGSPLLAGRPTARRPRAGSVRKGTLVLQQRPALDGAPRFGHTLVVRPGSWDRRPDTVRYQWLRGRPGDRRGAGTAPPARPRRLRGTHQRPGDGGQGRVRKATATSAETPAVGHRVPARHVVRYHVETRGDVRADVGVFERQAQQTYDDPRGWRGSGVRFRRVASGGAFTLVLAEASQVPQFSSGCSAEWSCRVGRFVIINQTRWLHASPMWHQVHRSLRDYRHMVVNHETGHWLGWDHRSCPRSSAPAPVMQQQSKGLDGCRANPWPTAAERNVPASQPRSGADLRWGRSGRSDAVGRVPDMTRADGRADDELRTVTLTRSWLDHAAGSVLVEFGRTRVLCAASASTGVPRWRKDSGLGWVTAEYAMLPVVHAHPLRPRVGQGPHRRPHPRDLPPHRPVAARRHRLQGVGREHDRARLRRAAGRRRHPHRGHHRGLRRARRRVRHLRVAGRAQGRATGRVRGGGVGRDHRRRAAPRPALRGGRPRRDRHERRDDRRRPLRGGAGHGRG